MIKLPVWLAIRLSPLQDICSPLPRLSRREIDEELGTTTMGEETVAALDPVRVTVLVVESALVLITEEDPRPEEISAEILTVSENVIDTDATDIEEVVDAIGVVLGKGCD